MKNKKILYVFLISAIILLFPIRVKLNDYPGVEYRAMLYKVGFYEPYLGATAGEWVEILGLTVRDTVLPPGGIVFEEEVLKNPIDKLH